MEARASFRINMTPDYELPEGFRSSVDLGVYINHVGQNRCFRGHQDVLKMARVPALVLEDDAVPACSNWLDEAQLASELLGDFDVVSLHGRALDETRFDATPWNNTRRILVPKKDAHGYVWSLGSLAYLIRREAVDRFLSMTYDGLPMDLTLANRFKFCVIEQSLFIHDRSEGTLIQ
jgi:hypothetical protein